MSLGFNCQQPGVQGSVPTFKNGNICNFKLISIADIKSSKNSIWIKGTDILSMSCLFRYLSFVDLCSRAIRRLTKYSKSVRFLGLLTLETGQKDLSWLPGWTSNFHSSLPPLLPPSSLQPPRKPLLWWRTCCGGIQPRDRAHNRPCDILTFKMEPTNSQMDTLWSKRYNDHMPGNLHCCHNPRQVCCHSINNSYIASQSQNYAAWHSKFPIYQTSNINEVN